jgi:hypothetical protein
MKATGFLPHALFGRRLEHFRAKWAPVRVKKMRQNKSIEPRSDSIGTEKALARRGQGSFLSPSHPDNHRAAGPRGVNMMAKLSVQFSTAVLLCMIQVGLAQAFTFHNTEGNFTVQVPEQPTFKKKTGTTADGTAYELSLWTVDQGQIAYIVTMNTYASSIREDYDGPVKAVAGSCKGKLIDQQPFQSQGLTGREIVVECPAGLMFRERLIWVHSKLYQFLFVGPPGSEKNSDVDFFLSSIQFGE